MRMNYTDIKQDIKAHWESLSEMPNPEDLINELADSAIPVYYGEIIKDWQEMPHQFDNVWHEEGYTGNSITALMTYDLFSYYSDQYHTVYEELCQEMETV